MKFLELRIDGFGKFRDFTLQFDEGVNVLFGRNEAGKSTLYAFLSAMLFGMEQKPGRAGADSVRERFSPWGAPEVYGGNLRIEAGGKTYRITRDFNQVDDGLLVYDEAEKKELPEPKAALHALLPGLTRTVWNNTVSIGQLKAATGRDMAAELLGTLKNISGTGSFGLSAEAAVDYLRRQREETLKNCHPETVRRYAGVVGRIKRLEEEINTSENENRIAQFLQKKHEVSEAATALSQREGEAKAKREAAARALLGQGFIDEAAVERCRREAEALWQEQSALWAVQRKAVGRVLPVLFLLLSLFGAAAAVWYSRESAAGIWSNADSQRFLLLFGGAALCLAAAFFGFGRRFARGRKLKKAEQALSACLDRQLGAGHGMPPAEADMQAFHAKLDSLLLRCREQKEAEETLAALSQETERLQREQLSCQEELTRQEQIRAGVEQKLMELYALKTQAEELQAIIAENERSQQEADAMELAAERITELAASMRGSLGVLLNREAGRLLAEVTGGAYRGLDVGDGTDIWLSARDRLIPLSAVSAGTMDQVYLALRMAAARLLCQGGETLPLLLDDSFVLYDDDRLRHALRFAASDWKGQLIVFSCHHREERALAALGIPCRLQRLVSGQMAEVGTEALV